jgi:heme/copper-type cytochrome/quinol oxidase subunit 2
MKSMRKQEALLVLIAIVVIVVIALIARRNGPAAPGTHGAPGSSSSTTGVAGNPLESSTRTDAPQDATVPEENASNVGADIAVPHLVTAAGPNVPYKYRSFDITVNNNKFTPATVTVNEKDTVHLNITAQDGAYDFYQPDYGLSTPLPKGEKKVVEFGANLSGKLTFYCQSCGGPDKGPVGYVIVVPAKQ